MRHVGSRRKWRSLRQTSPQDTRAVGTTADQKANHKCLYRSFRTGLSATGPASRVAASVRHIALGCGAITAASPGAFSVPSSAPMFDKALMEASALSHQIVGQSASAVIITSSSTV